MEKKEQYVRSERLPLTRSQAAMWLQWKYAETSPAYNNPLLFELKGEANVPRLQRAFAALVDWHEALRMRFVEADGVPFQYLVQREGEVLDFHDLSHLDGAEREAHTQALLDSYLRAPFDLLRDRAYRFSLLKTEAHRYLLTVNVHHICADGISAAMLLDEISRDYGRADLDPVPVSEPRPDGFIAYLEHEAREWTGVAAEEAQSFWRRQLGGTRLTVDFSSIHHPELREPLAGSGRHYWKLAPGDFAAVKQLVRQTRSTLFITLAAALKILLRRYSGQDNISLAYPVDIRPPRFQNVSGCLINYLPLNTHLSSRQTVAELIEAIKEVRRGSKSFATYPHLEIARIVREGSNFRERQVFNVALTSANFALAGLKLEGLDVQVHPVFAGDAKEDFGLLFEAGESLLLAFEHRCSVLPAAVVEEMASEFNHLLLQMAADPSRTIGSLELKSEPAFAARFQPIPPAPEQQDLSALLLERIRLFRQEVLAGGRGEALTGARIEALSNAVAYLLLSRGVRRGDRVGVQLSRSTLLLPALLGIWRLGACYVPIDPDLPAERKAYLTEDAQLKLRLVDANLPAKALSGLDCPLSFELLDALPERISPPPAQPGDIAYVLYTSGSTGRPKGVEVLHSNVVSFLRGMQERLRMGPGDRLLAVTTIGFDISILELLLPLVAGATVIICPAEQARDVFALQELLVSERINHLQGTPSFFRMLIAGGWEGKQDLRVMCGGEPLDVPTCSFLLGSCRELWNFYGPTETTVWSMLTPIVDSSNIHLGEPLLGTTIHLLDRQGQALPRHVKGELFIGGLGVAKGYRNRPELTAERFVTLPSGERLYRTGDIVYRSGRDELHFIGREDGQVKIRGYRIELGEVEHRIEAIQGIRKAVVLPMVSQAGEQSLSAWVEAAQSTRLTAGELRAELSRSLPGYMIPSLFHFMEQWPLNASGKIDRKALKVQAAVGTAERPDEQGPRLSALRARLEAIYRDILGLASIDPSLNIFELGGQSLIAARIVARLHKEFSVALSLREFMENSSLGQLERLLPAKGIRAPAPEQGVSGSGATVPAQVQPPEIMRPTSNERAMFFINSIARCQEAYNIPIVLRFSSGLHVGKLSAAVREVLGQHAQLRANFEQTHEGIQKRIRPQLPEELVYQHPRVKWRDIRALLTPQVHRRFDLAKDLLLSVHHFPLEEGDDVVLYVFHHILLDGVSCGHFLGEVGRVYQRLVTGSQVATPSLPVEPVGDAHEAATDPVRLEQLIEEFGLRDRVLALPYSAPLPEVRTLEGTCHESRLTEPQRAALEEISRDHGLPVSVLVLAAYTLALHHASRDEVINVGLAMMNRTPQNFSRLGLFTNTVVLPITIDRSETVLALLQRMATSLFSIYRYSDVPFQDVVSRLVESPNLGVTPLFQAFFNFMDRAMYDFSMGNLRAEEIPFRPNGSKFELSLEVHDLKTHSLLCFEYSTEVFERATIEALAGLMQRIIVALPRSLDRSIERLLLSAR